MVARWWIMDLTQVWAWEKTFEGWDTVADRTIQKAQNILSMLQA